MAKILKRTDREFKEDANKIDHFRLFSDTSRTLEGVTLDAKQKPEGIL